MWMHGLGGMYGLGGLGMVVSLVFWAALIAGIVALVVWAVRQAGGRGAAHGHEPDALAILKQRYAKGEISRDEYLRMKQDLSG